MYARTNYPQADDLHIPTNYAGTAFRDTVSGEETVTEEYIATEGEPVAASAEECFTAKKETEARRKENASFFSLLTRGRGFSLSSILDALPFSRFFGREENDKKKACDTFPLGMEDIWLLLLAAFLFFSDSGDKTCALILIALLVFT